MNNKTIREKTAQQLDSILEDFPPETIKQRFDFMFQGFLNVSDGMLGKDLSELFELLNRTSDLFKTREQETVEMEHEKTENIV